MKAGVLSPLRAAAYFVLLTASVVFISFKGGLLPFLLFFTLFLQIPVFLLYLIYVNRYLKIHQETHDRHLSKSEECDLLLVLENSGFLPVGSLTLNVEKRVSSLKNLDSAKCFELYPGQRLEEHLRLTCLYAGTYPVGVLSFSVTDPFGIFSFTFEVPQKYRAIVKPEIAEDPSGEISRLLPEDEALFQNRSLFEDTLGNDLKKYEKGDRLSGVHWKLYAKTGKLFTRLRENRDVGMFTLLLASKPVREEEAGDIIRRDAFLTFCVSAAYFFAGQKKPVEIVFAKGDWVRLIVDSYESFEEFYVLITEGIYCSSDERLMCENEERELKSSGRRLLTIYEREFEAD